MDEKPFDPDNAGPLKATEKLARYSAFIVIALIAIVGAVQILSWLASRP